MITVYWIMGAFVCCTIVAALVQLSLIRMALKDAPQPHWDNLVEALWEVHRAAKWGWLAKITMPIGQRLWPAIDDAPKLREVAQRERRFIRKEEE